MPLRLAKFLDVADGLQPGQFAVGSRETIEHVADLDPNYRDLMDRPIAVVMALIGPDGRPSLTPMWFDYEGDTILVNVAQHRPKASWISEQRQITMLLMNPENMYHWMSMKVTVEREISEDDPDEGERVTAQLNRIWQKYIGQGEEYGLRDPSITERRVLFECRIDKIATFGKP